MFTNCIVLKKINFGNNFHSENIINANSMFAICASLDTITWRDYQPFDNLKNAFSMFDGCKKLEKIDLRGVNFSKVKTVHNMFINTNPDLKVLVNSSFDNNKLKN